MDRPQEEPSVDVHAAVPGGRRECGFDDRLLQVLDEHDRERSALPRVGLPLQPFEGHASRPRREDV
eukprot:5039736-Heterocapsa_arctica.AAC.1